MVSLSTSWRAIALSTLFVATVRADALFVTAPLTDAANSYVAGNGAGSYTNTSAAVGEPGATVGGSNILDPYSPHYETTELTGIGLGGRVAYQFSQPLKVQSNATIGVFTNVGINDTDYPNANPGSTAQSYELAFAGAERTAVVEVADTVGNWKSLGRITFDLPVNYYANAAGAYDAVEPNGTKADFGKPFTGSLSSFNNESFSQLVSTLAGSAGGTWLTIPQSLGLSSVQYIRFSSPEWKLASDGSLVDSVSYFGTPTNAAVYLNGISANNAAVPEPAFGSVVCLLSLYSGRGRVRGRASKRNESR